MKRNLFIILIVLAIVITLFVTNKSKAISNPADFSEELTLTANDPIGEAVAVPLDNDQAVSQDFIVDVKGEVGKPGVYTVGIDDRVVDAIMLAGGFTEDADQNQVNLAQRVHDEMVVYIPKAGELTAGNEITQSSPTNQTNGIQINRATLEEIQTLNGIGPSKAEAIITYREENGPFTSVDELLNVSGIGEKTLEKFKDDIVVP